MLMLFVATSWSAVFALCTQDTGVKLLTTRSRTSAACGTRSGPGVQDHLASAHVRETPPPDASSVRHPSPHSPRPPNPSSFTQLTMSQGQHYGTGFLGGQWRRRLGLPGVLAPWANFHGVSFDHFSSSSQRDNDSNARKGFSPVVFPRTRDQT